MVETVVKEDLKKKRLAWYSEGTWSMKRRTGFEAASKSEKKSRRGNEASRSLSRSGDAGYAAARYTAG